jgi:hypothetical protein
MNNMTSVPRDILKKNTVLYKPCYDGKLSTAKIQ